MNLILLAENRELHSAQRLLEEATLLKLDPRHISPGSTSITTDPHCLANDQTIVLHRSTGIRFDDFDLALSLDLEQQGAGIFNPTDVLIKLRDKQMQTVFFKHKEVNLIPSFMFRGPVDDQLIHSIQSSFAEISDNNSFILKTTRGNKGIGVNIINGITSLSSILETFHALEDQKFILQPYLPGGDEYRLFMTGEVILGAIKKESSGDEFRKNARRGAGQYIAEKNIPTKIQEFARLAMNRSGAAYAGVDILEWNDQVFLLELNLVPGFKQMEELSQKNIAKELLIQLTQSVK